MNMLFILWLAISATVLVVLFLNFRKHQSPSKPLRRSQGRRRAEHLSPIDPAWPAYTSFPSTLDSPSHTPSESSSREWAAPAEDSSSSSSFDSGGSSSDSGGSSVGGD